MVKLLNSIGPRAFVAFMSVMAMMFLAVSPAAAAESAAEPAKATAKASDSYVEAEDAPDVFLLFTGDVIGYLEDCGCKKNPAGGIDRRAWVLEQLEEKFPGTPRVLLDSGNFSDNPTAEGDRKTSALLEAMDRMGYEVINVGERDIRTGYDEFLRRTKGADFQFTSANIVRQDNLEPVFPPHVVVEVGDDGSEPLLRIGVIGVVRYNQIFLKAGPDGANMVIAHPIERVEQEVAALKAKNVDAIVVLGALPKPDAVKLIEAVPGIDYLMGAYGGVYTVRSEEYGDTKLFYAGNRGQRISETRLFLDVGEDGRRIARDKHRMHFLTRHYPSDPDMLAFLKEATGK